jgi:hypothetical protein
VGWWWDECGRALALYSEIKTYYELTGDLQASRNLSILNYMIDMRVTLLTITYSDKQKKTYETVVSKVEIYLDLFPSHDLRFEQRVCDQE